MQVTDGQITDPFVLNWLDLLCFLLSGLPANGTIAAEVAFMFNEWYRPNSSLEFPRGGSQAMVNALVRYTHDALSNAHCNDISASVVICSILQTVLSHHRHLIQAELSSEAVI